MKHKKVLLIALICLIGIGTVISMLGVGRVVAAFNHLCKPAITRAAGLEKVVRK